MNDGVYYDMSIMEYLEAPAIRHGDLTLAADALARWKYHADHAQADATWMPFGQAFHYRVLEPPLFDGRVAVSPKFDRRTKAGKEDSAAWEDKNVGKLIISQDDFDLIEGMAAAVERSAEAQKVLEATKCEISVFWTEKETGKQCKCRLDAYRQDTGVIVEIKGVRSAKRGFSSQIIDCGWHRQAAWQREGLRFHGLPASHVVFIAVEKDRPHLLTVSELSADHVDLAARSNVAILKRIHAAILANQFPGYDQFIEEFTLPDWAVKQLEGQL
jgi:hypothetical protein